MNNAVFGKTMENVRKHRDIKPVTKEETIWCQNQIIVLQSSSQKIYLQQKKNKKTERLTNKPVHLGLSILELSKILMH